MGIRQLLIAVCLLAVLGGALYWSNKKKKEAEGKPSADAPPKILTIPDDQLQQVEVRKGGDVTTIRRKSDGKWEITAPKPLPVDQDSVSSLTSTVTSLSSDRLVEDKATDLAAYGLTSPALEVVVTRKDGKAQKLFIGDETPTAGAFFARLDGDPRVFTVASYNKTSLDKTWKDLRDKRLLTFDSDRITRVELSARKEAMEFGKNTQNEWQVLKPRPLRADGGQVEELVRRLKDAKMDPSVSDEDAKKAAAAFASGTPIAVAKVTDAAGTQQLEVRKKESDYYGRGSAVEGVYKLTADIGDGLNKGLDDFRNKKLFDFGFSDPGKIEIRDGDKTRVLQKSGDKWTSGGKEMDSPGVQILIDRLRDLQAARFPDKGFTTPVLEATVTSNDGKRVEKVQLSKQGNDWFARRENEPSIYQVDTGAVTELQKAAGDLKEAQAKPPEQKKK